jgi:hypothetical protein
MTPVTSSPDDLADKARKIKQKNVGQKNKERLSPFFIFLSHIFLFRLFLLAPYRFPLILLT